MSPPLWEVKRQVRTTFPSVDLRDLAEKKTSFHLRVKGILGNLAKRKEIKTYYTANNTLNVEEVEVTNQQNETNPVCIQVGRVSDIFDIFF